MSEKEKILCLMGPTAAGKTELALEWSHQYPCDIVSVDSALVYRGMDIGTAKPSLQTLKDFPHRLINILDPVQAYSAADFCRDAVGEIEAILKTRRIPLLVGGTMMYFRALQQGLSKLPPADASIRQQLEEETARIGIVAMHRRLKQVDPIAAEKIKPTDTQRIQRALEVFEITGQALSHLHAQKSAPLPYDFINIGIIPEDRRQLHKKIARRFHTMIAQGFIEEVEALKSRGDLNLTMPSMRAVGYRQVWEYLEGKISKDEMIEKAIIATRQLAKRQLTWLRSWPDLRRDICDLKLFVPEILDNF